MINITFYFNFAASKKEMENSKCATCHVKSNAVCSLNSSQIEQFEIGCRQAIFRAGEIIIKQNTYSSSVAYVKSGLVKLHLSGSDREHTLKIINAPNYVCLASSISDLYNHFSITAIEDAEICYIDAATFKKFILENSFFSSQIILDLCRNELRTFHSQVNGLKKQVFGRIAQHLLFFAEDIYFNNQFCLPITRQDLADLSNTTRENVSRYLSELNNEGIISIKGKRISILNEKFLKEIRSKG